MYINILLCNLRFMLKRHRPATLLNILGMSVAFTAFMIILMQLVYDRTFNTPIPDCERIFLNYTTDKDNTRYTYISLPYMDKIASISPHVEGYAYLYYEASEVLFVNDTYEDSQVSYVSPNWPTIFGFRMLVGGNDCLADSRAVIVPASFALAHFGTTDVVGKTVDTAHSRYIAGVYRDFPDNCLVKNKLYASMPIDNELAMNWNYNSFTMFLKVDSPSAINEITNGINAFLKQDDNVNPFRESFGFVPLSKLHFTQGIEGSPDQPVQPATQIALISIAIAIILIAAINYVNFANSLMPARLHSINTQKILGATTRSLRTVLVAESAAICITACLVAIGLTAILSATSFSSLTDAGMSPSDNSLAVLATLAVALLVGIAAGIIPAFRSTSFSPAVALKGNFGLSPAGKALRTAVIGLQFFISAVLIVVACYMQRQRAYLTRTADYGFAKDELIVCDLTAAQFSANLQTVAEAVRKLPFVSGTTFSWSTLAENNNSQGWVFKDVNQNNVDPRTLFVESDFLSAMDIRIVEGRDFAPTDTNVMVANRLCRDKYPESIQVGKFVHFGATQYEIIGICDDFKFSSLNDAVQPVLMVKMKDYPCRVLNIRVAKGTSMFDAVSRIRATLDTFQPGFPFKIRFYDQILDDTYQRENRMTSLITTFSALAVIISIIGVFGLVMFDSEYRRREIAVRKVFGATTANIVRMFNLRYLAILAVGFVMAMPVAWTITTRWLENFAYKISLSPWVIVLAFVVLAVITSVTVTGQCLRIARSNPVESLKYE